MSYTIIIIMDLSSAYYKKNIGVKVKTSFGPITEDGHAHVWSVAVNYNCS